MIFLSGRSRGHHKLKARDDRGATAVEYALMVSLIAVVIVSAVALFGRSVLGLFTLITSTAPFS